MTSLLKDPKYLRAVTDMVTRIDRILSGEDKINVHIQPGTIAPLCPAYQHGNDIYLVPEEIEKMVNDATDEDEILPLLLALNLHEYGHYDFTPRPDNPAWDKVKKSLTPDEWGKVFMALNMLEDQRQELLVSARFPRSRNYFRLATLRAMIRVKKAIGRIPPENFLLYHARRHILPRPLVKRMEDSFTQKHGQKMTDHVKRLIDEFVQIPATNDMALQRMIDISTELKGLMDQMRLDRSPCMGHGAIGARVSKSAQEKLSSQVGRLLGQIDQTQEDLEGEKDDSEDSKNSLDDLLKNYLKKAGLLAAKDLHTQAETIRGEIFGEQALRLGKLFKIASTDLGMIDHSRLRRGKLDLRRLVPLVARNDPRVFKKRRLSLKSEAAMLVHIAYDSSGSMNGIQKEVVSAASTIAKACWYADHHTKVTTFSSDIKMIKDWHEPEVSPAKLKWYGGGTEPLPLLLDAMKDYKKAQDQYESYNKILIIITDGYWGDPNACAEQMYKLKAQGVHILLVGIGAEVKSYGSREYACDASIVIHANQLEGAMRGWLKKLSIQLAQEAVRRHGE